MAGKDQPFLRGVDMWKGDYFKRKGNSTSNLEAPIHFLPKCEKTDDWKRSVSDYYEYIGLSKVSYSYDDIIKNRWMSSGVLNITDYKKSKKTGTYEALNNISRAYNFKPKEDEDNSGFDFYPLVPNLVNLMTGYQLKRNSKVYFSCVDEFSKAELFDIKDKIFKDELKNILNEMKEAAVNGEDPDYIAQQQKLVDAQVKFKNYKDVGIDWANRVHKINLEKHNVRELIKQAFKESYLNSGRVIFHLNMLSDRFILEHIDESLAFNGACPNTTDIAEGSDYIGWFRWMNIGEIVNIFGKQLKDEDIEKFKSINSAISSSGNNNLNLINFWNNQTDGRFGGDEGILGSDEGYDATRPYLEQSNDPLDIVRYKRMMEKTTGIKINNPTTVSQIGPDINPDFNYGVDKLYRVLYLYVKSQKKLGWLTKVDRTGQITFQDWVNEDVIITEKPVYDNSLYKENSLKNLLFGEHIDWEWVPDWKRFITLTPNPSHTSFNSLGVNLEKIYFDGNSLDFQFKNDKTPYGVKPPIVATEVKMRGVKTVSFVSLLRQEQVIYNIAKNRVKYAIANDRGLILSYPTNAVSRVDSDDIDDGDILHNYEEQIRKNKTLRLTYDKAYLQGLNGQLPAPQVINLSTLDEALKYDQLAEKIWYNALRTVGVTPQAIGEIKASETVNNANSAQQISQVQTEILFDDFNTKFLPQLYQRMLEATQYYSVINEDFRVTYMNEKEENTWLDITGINLLHKDFMCTPKYSFDNQEFSEMLKRMAFDNTLQESLLTRLKVVANADENIPKVLTILEEAEQKAQEAAQQLEQNKQKQLQDQIAHEQQLLDKELANTNEQKELDRQSKEYIAQLNILGGGLQTDSNANQELDSMENFRNVLKQRELSLKESNAIENMDFEKQKHQDTLNLKREQLIQKQNSDAMKLKASVVNRNKYSDKNTDNKVLK